MLNIPENVIVLNLDLKKCKNLKKYQTETSNQIKRQTTKNKGKFLKKRKIRRKMREKNLIKSAIKSLNVGTTLQTHYKKGKKGTKKK